MNIYEVLELFRENIDELEELVEEIDDPEEKKAFTRVLKGRLKHNMELLNAWKQRINVS